MSCLHGPGAEAGSFLQFCTTKKTPGQQAPLGAVLKAEVLIQRADGTGGRRGGELSTDSGADKTKCC